MEEQRGCYTGVKGILWVGRIGGEPTLNPGRARRIIEGDTLGEESPEPWNPTVVRQSEKPVGVVLTDAIILVSGNRETVILVNTQDRLTDTSFGFFVTVILLVLLINFGAGDPTNRTVGSTVTETDKMMTPIDHLVSRERVSVINQEIGFTDGSSDLNITPVDLVFRYLLEPSQVPGATVVTPTWPSRSVELVHTQGFVSTVSVNVSVGDIFRSHTPNSFVVGLLTVVIIL